MITVRVLLFAAARDAVGESERTLTLPEGASAGDLVTRLLAEHPSLGPWKDHLRIAVNESYSSPAHQLSDGDEVALIPPVSGG